MMIKRNTSNPIILLLLIGLVSTGLIACKGGAEAGQERPVRETASGDQRNFDPLELTRDKEIIPQRYPRSGAIEGSATLIEMTDENETDANNVLDLPLPTDTIQSQLYRVQLLTSKVYGDARHAVTVAEEIFDQLVYLDYEVPYYKVRTGDFATRELAEEYQMKAKASGYPSCWVVVVNVSVKEAPLVYDDLIELPVNDSAETDRPEPSEENDELR